MYVVPSAVVLTSTFVFCQQTSMDHDSVNSHMSRTGSPSYCCIGESVGIIVMIFFFRMWIGKFGKSFCYCLQVCPFRGLLFSLFAQGRFLEPGGKDRTSGYHSCR